MAAARHLAALQTDRWAGFGGRQKRVFAFVWPAAQFNPLP